MRALPPTITPARFDAGRRGLPSRFVRQPFGLRLDCRRASQWSVTAPLDLLGYCRWDGRSGRVTMPDNHRNDFQVAPIRKSRCVGHLHSFPGCGPHGSRLAVRRPRSQPRGSARADVLTPLEPSAGLDALASARCRRDRGTRSLPSDDPVFLLQGRASALGTSLMAVFFWQRHRPYAAWQTWSALLPLGCGWTRSATCRRCLLLQTFSISRKSGFLSRAGPRRAFSAR